MNVKVGMSGAYAVYTTKLLAKISHHFLHEGMLSLTHIPLYTNNVKLPHPTCIVYTVEASSQ